MLYTIFIKTAPIKTAPIPVIGAGTAKNEEVETDPFRFHKAAMGKEGTRHVLTASVVQFYTHNQISRLPASK